MLPRSSSVGVLILCPQARSRWVSLLPPARQRMQRLVEPHLTDKGEPLRVFNRFDRRDLRALVEHDPSGILGHPAFVPLALVAGLAWRWA